MPTDHLYEPQPPVNLSPPTCQPDSWSAHILKKSKKGNSVGINDFPNVYNNQSTTHQRESSPFIMYIKVAIGEYTRGESGEDGYHPAGEVLVNPDCPIRLIYDYIRKKFQVDNDLELDLCDDGGNLLFIHEKDPWINGLNYFIPLSTYFVVLFEKDEENRITTPLLYLPEAVKKFPAQWSDIMTKIRKQLNPGLTNKQSRMSRTRSGTSHLK